MVKFSDGEFRVINASSFGGKISADTRVLIVKYEPETDEFKVERYE
jgi:hypothetical protein